MKVATLNALFFLLFTAVPALAGSKGNTAERFESLLIWSDSIYQTQPHTKAVYQQLISDFNFAIEYSKNFDYSDINTPILMDFKLDKESRSDKALVAKDKKNKQFQTLLSKSMPLLGYAYQTPPPAPNQYYKNEAIKKLYIKALEYAYKRGFNDKAWIVDHGGNISKILLKQGFKREAGDISSMSLHLGGVLQSIFLMKEELKQAGLLKKYRTVMRHFVINHGVMAGSFFEHANKVTLAAREIKDGKLKPYYLNADGVRLFVDYFVPYFLLIENSEEKAAMAKVLQNVAKTNIAILPGSQGTIKPDGSGYHHQNAYIGGYAPFTLEAMAQLIYLTAGDVDYSNEQIDALKLALTSFRQMMHHYTVSNSLSGRLIQQESAGAAIAINKAMAFLAHPDGLNDAKMQAAFKEFYLPKFINQKENSQLIFLGKRGIDIRGLGIFEVVDDVAKLNVLASESPKGMYVKPYANSAFVHSDKWMATIKGFSQYLWDYEGPINKQQNTYGQNWSYGLFELQVGDKPLSKVNSGLDIDNGFDWYHMPGTTASHYPIIKRSKATLAKERERLGIIHTTQQRNYSQTSFVGGAVQNNIGVFAVDLQAVAFDKPTDLTAQKSYFILDDYIIALGSNINGGTISDETHTTLFQTKVSNHSPSAINGELIKGDVAQQFLTNNTPTFTDAVGNSFVLRSTNAPVEVEFGKQLSLSQKFKATQGNYYSAYLNHGIKPNNHHYEYVVIPQSDLANSPKKINTELDNLYKVEANGGLHAISFPQNGSEAYAFYELIESPQHMHVKSVNKESTLIATQSGDDLTLTASVPDLGWDIPKTKKPFSLSDAVKYFDTAQAKTHTLKITLRGSWQSDNANIKAMHKNGLTVVELICKDGKTEMVKLQKH